MWHLVFWGCETECAMFYAVVFFAEGVKHLLGSETLSHESWENCRDDSATNINTFLARCWFPSSFLAHSSSFILVKAHIARPSVIIEVQEGAREHFYFLLRPLALHQWSPVSQLRPSSSIGRLKSFWQIAESKDLEKSGSRSCVFISSQTNTNSLLNIMALLAFDFPFGKLD